MKEWIIEWHHALSLYSMDLFNTISEIRKCIDVDEYDFKKE